MSEPTRVSFLSGLASRVNLLAGSSASRSLLQLGALHNHVDKMRRDGFSSQPRVAALQVLPLIVHSRN
jgi:hypothetical protein